MEFEKKNQLSDDIFDESINIREELDKYLKNIKWFIVSISIVLALSYFYLRSEVPMYGVTSKILINDKEEGSSLNQLDAFEDLGIFGSNKNNSLENEIQILTSRRLMIKVVEELKLNIKYFIESSPYDLEQYPNSPIIIDFPEDSLLVGNLYSKRKYNITTSFKIYVKSNLKFEYFDDEDNSKGIMEFGKKIKTSYGFIIIKLNDYWKNKVLDRNIIVKINRLDPIVDNYNRRVSIEPLDDKSRVISISIKEAVEQKGIAIINNLIEQYNEDAIEDKNQVYKKTTEFLNDRLILITSELNAIESTVEQFKTSKGLIDTKAGAEIYLQSSSMNENQLIDVNTQLQLVDYMITVLNKNDSNELLPANIGLSDPSIIALIGEFNTLILRRNRILKSSTIRNPLIVGIDSQISVLKSNLVGSLNTIESSLRIQISALSDQRGKIGSRIASVPKNEKEFMDIVRQQETKNAVYLFLLQKREESILSNAVTIKKARIVDVAYSNGRPVSPRPSSIYFAAFLIGIFVPVGFIYLKYILDTKVHNENDIKASNIPYIGDIPLASSKRDLYLEDGDNSKVAESFRYIRTNINFMLDRKDKGKTVFITSTLSGEGKTFTAINLAFSLAISGKKTLLLAMDLRAPKITKYLDTEELLGVTNFIKNNELVVNDIIERHTKFDNLHLINSGDIPPNPVELLMSNRVDDIFQEVKGEYEYIIVDTAPVGLVTDTIQISKYADLTIYVIKANFLDKRLLHIPEKLNKGKRLYNMAYLINGADNDRGGYGYGYGYGDNKKKKPWYKFT